jgi:Zn finger protein HypA/HybF involved in hydrogenase expression
MKSWWCMECEGLVKLDRHGRCENCDSEAVDLAQPLGDLTTDVSTTNIVPVWG